MQSSAKMSRRPLVVAANVALGVAVASAAMVQAQEAAEIPAPLVEIAEYGALLAPLLEPEQVRAWERLRDDAARERFVREFWAQLDPTPGTEANERREIYEARARRAIEEFSDGDLPGYATDRGKVLMVLRASRRTGVASAARGVAAHADLAVHAALARLRCQVRRQRRPSTGAR